MNTNKIYAESIAKEYAPKDTSKIIALRKLDRKAKRPANIFTVEGNRGLKLKDFAERKTSSKPHRRCLCRKSYSFAQTKIDGSFCIELSCPISFRTIL